MKLSLVAVATLAAALTACGGGGSSSAPPTAAPQTHKVGFTATAIGGQSGAASVARKHVSATCPSNPTSIALQAIPASQPSDNWTILNSGSNVAAVEYDVNCNVVSSSPTYTIANTALVSTTFPSWYASYITTAPAGSVNLAGLEPGTTTLTATFPDTTTASVTADVFGTTGVMCDPQNVFDGTTSRPAGQAWSASLGYAVVENPGATCYNSGTGTDPNDPAVDMQVTSVAGSTGISFPYGYDVVSTGSSSYASINALVGIANCSGFTSQGTVLPLPNPAQVPAPTTFIQVLEFKTSTGACVKFAPTVQTLGAAGPDLIGYYEVSDSSGNFAY